MSQGIGYFLDDLGEWPNTPSASVIIGNEKGTTFQDPINKDGRLFGFTASLNAQGSELWEIINAEVDPTAILDAAFNKDQGKSSVLKNRGDSSKWFYAQNFQVTDIKSATANPDEVYAGVAAVLWAFDQLYPSIDSIPVFDSYYVKSLGDYDASKIQTMLSPIFNLEVKNSPKQLQWNFISILYENGLIDGFIGDVYTLGKEGKFPTGADVKPFASSVPYALQSTWDNLPNEGGIITTDFDGTLPVNGSVYFSGSVPHNFVGSDYLKPINNPISILSSPPAQGREPVQFAENIQIVNNFEQSTDVNDFVELTDDDNYLTDQRSPNLRMMGGNDYIEVTGGMVNFVNGNLGNDTIVLKGGLGKYLGGKGNDIFEVYNAEEGTFVNGNLGEDIITGFARGVIYRGGNDNDIISCQQGEAWGDQGADIFCGLAGEGYAVIQDYTAGEDFVKLLISGSWSQFESGLMFTDDSGDQIMLLAGINDVQSVSMI